MTLRRLARCPVTRTTRHIVTDVYAAAGARCPEIGSELLLGVIDNDPERTDALSDPKKAEEWVQSHHPAVFDEWRHAPDG